ncbi:MAG TPA: hypothetical protein VHP11_10810, partial [Tepidisphaeraceae bacterium]|nr:hypothetical protein [Tepidisphaeraceae bacterium]
MTIRHEHSPASNHPHCCGSGACARSAQAGISRRQFLTASGIALSAVAMSGMVWQSAFAADVMAQPAPTRKPLVVKPVLAYETPTRRPQTSWRNWGGIQTEQDAQQEVARIKAELDKLQASADFPITFLPISAVKDPNAMLRADDFPKADAILLYAAGGPQSILQAAADSGKNTLFFLRHRSGPVSLWYEIISPRFLHDHKDQLSDKLAAKNVSNNDVIVDNFDEVLWRLRSLCGLKNALGTRIVAIGGPAGWATPEAPDLARAKWKLDIQTVTYEQLAPMLAAALADKSATQLAAERAAAYLNDPQVKLETEKPFVQNAFLLEQVFKTIMARANATSITVNNCMGAIMPISKTTACLTLSLLNDAGYLAFCESDFVVIPSGILLSHIAGKPNFLNDPTYPHDGVITLAHCTSPPQARW